MLKAVFCCVVGVGIALARGGAPGSLDRLAATSDHIVIGKIVEGSASGVTVHLSIDIERVLKGTLTAGSLVSATGTTTDPSETHAAPRDRGIFFLAAGEGGVVRLVAPLSGYLSDERSNYIPLPDVASAVQIAGSTPKEQVMLELLAVLESGQQRPHGGMIDWLWEYRCSPTANVRSVFRRWLQGTSSKLIAISLQALIPEGDIEALTRVATDESLKSNPSAEIIFGKVREFRNPDATAVALLGRLATSSSTNIKLRGAAATALGWIHTQQTLPYLAQLLGEQNVTLVAAAVGGLSGYANNLPVGGSHPAAGAWKHRTDETMTHSVFDENAIRTQSDYFVGYWKAWWQQRQAELQ